MKLILNKLLLLGMVLALFYGCSEHTPVSTDVGEVEELSSPEDGYSVELEPNGSETFEWSAATAEDSGMVMYEVAFDEVGGDFSDPFFSITSDDNGVLNTATLSHETLNQAAAEAGLESEETGEMDWTVISSRGVNQQIAPESRTIEVTRLAGFAEVPENLFITGEGTEAGGSLENAMPLKSIEDGEFEIYTRLTTDGSYKFVSDKSDSPREFVIDGNTITEDGSETTIDEDGVYRFELNFTTGSASITKIEAVEFYSAPHNDYLFELIYQQDGVFLAEEEAYSFYEWSWGLDSRYKFRLTVTNQNGEESYEWWGNDDADAVRPSSDSPDSYWYVYPVPESADQWQYTFKFNEEMDDSIINMYMRFQTDIENYTHEVIKVRDQE